MQESNHDLRTEWQPPPRPEWVQRINEEGYCMDIGGVVPLDATSLIDSAMRSTGLSDFGSDDWREPFQVLVKSLDTEADLNLMGRLMTRSELLQLLCARLQIEDCYKHHPEIDEEQIVEPIFVVGQGRSGTSFLINLLGASPDNGAMPQWQATFPCPPPEQGRLEGDPRIDRADKLIRQWVRVSPSVESMHEFGGTIPFECMQVLALSFRSSSYFVALGQAASYETYIAQQDMTPALEYHKRVLKLLQWRNPRKHWVLKDPMHLYRMPFMLKFYPDARFVWPHRDPVRALASTISLIGTLQWGRSDHPFKGGSFEYILNPENAAAGMNMVIDQIESGAIPPGHLHNMLYNDLVENTMPTIAAMYRALNLELSEAGQRGMSDYLAAHPRTARPTHRLKKGSDDSIARARQAFKRYQDYFHIPNE